VLNGRHLFWRPLYSDVIKLIIKLGRIHSNFDFERGGFNLKYGNLENGEMENIFVSKIGKTASSKECDGKLKFNLDNSYVENGVGN